MDTETRTVKGIDLRVHMYLTIGLNEHMIVDLAPVRSFTKNGLHTQHNRTLVSILNSEETVHIIVENEHEYEVRNEVEF